MDYRILGPLEVLDDGRQLALGGTRQRALLAILLLHANEVVSTDRLVEELWGENPPETGAKALQVAVSQLRKTLQSTAGADGLLVTRSPGYLLNVHPGELDLDRFEALVQEAEKSRDAGSAATALGQALALWRGPALADLAYESFAQPAIARLEEARLAALEDRIDADLQLSRHTALVGELEELVAAHPVRERLRGQLMLALYRSGRQAEALEAYQTGRRALVEELGIEPGPELQKLQREILEQDPALGAPAKARRPAGSIQALESRRNRWLVAGLGLALLAAAGIAAAVLSRGGGTDPLVVPPNSVAAIDPASNEVVEAISVDEGPGPIGAGTDGLWVLNRSSKTVSRIDPRKRRLLDTTGIGGFIESLAVAGSDVWVADCKLTDSLVRLDPKTGTPAWYGGVSLHITEPGEHEGPTSTTLSFPGCGLAAEGRSAWAAGDVPPGLIRVDLGPADAAGTSRAHTALAVRLRQAPTAIAVGFGSVWVAESSGDLVRQIDPQSGDLLRVIEVGRSPAAVAVGADAVWVANRGDDSVSRIDPRTSSVRQAISVGDQPVGLAVGEDAVWVANSGDGTVSRIDPATNKVVETIEIGHSPQGVAVTDGLVWVTVRS